jgi:hypothetical protein
LLALADRAKTREAKTGSARGGDEIVAVAPAPWQIAGGDRAKAGPSMSPQEPRAEVAIHVSTIGQLFNSFDPSPFREKDLDDDAEDYIVSWVRELPPDAPFDLVIHLSAAEAGKPETEGVQNAFARYFTDRAARFDHEQRELFRIGRRSLAIGMLALFACLAASQLLAPLIPYPTLARVVEESLIFVGWVANWRPLEIYLYDWWPIRRRARLYRRIAAAPVILRAG